MKRPTRTVARIQYEREGSDRRATGSVPLRGGGWWSADLVVSLHREDQILLTLQRYPAPGQDDETAPVDLCLRPADLDALSVLLSGVIAHARRDGICR